MADKFVSLITGAAQGIGAAIATHLAKHGHNIVLNYYSHEERAQQTAEECRKLGAEVLVLQADVSDPEQCKKLVAATIAEFGYIDLLVNNAAISPFSKVPIHNIEEQDFSMFDKVFHTNVLGMLILSQAVTPHMKKRGHGSIINISSNAGLSGGTNSSIIYAISKGAVNTLTLSLSKILKPTIRVNAICPGVVDSTWWEKRFSEEKDRAAFLHKMAEHNPLGKVITPQEIANTVLFLFSNDNINGELIRIDSGSH